MCPKILVVDDHSEVLETISEVLTQSGHSVETACNGKECIDKIKANEFHMLFLDVMMPGMDGQKVAKSIKTKHGKDLKIVFVTAKPKAELDMSYADDFIQKPFGIGEIIISANKHLYM